MTESTQQETSESEETTSITIEPVSIMKKLLGTGEDGGIQRSNLLDLSEQMASGFSRAGALAPPLDPLSLVRLVGMSGTMRPLIDAMAVNIHGFGYRFEPVIDLDASDTIDRVRAAMLLEGEIKAEGEAAAGEDPEDIDPPSDDEVRKRIDSLRDQMRRERAKLEAFFRNASRDISLPRLNRKMHVDKESTGWGVIEVRRNGRGEPSRMNYAPSWSFRALPLGKVVMAKTSVRATDISFRTIEEPVRFRRYVQIYENITRYFKEFGDERAMSAKTGQYYSDLKTMQKEEGESSLPATELLWFALDSSESDVYALVRWSGCIPGVIGSREQAEVNLLFFRSKAIPPMVVLVSGGKLARGARKRLEDLIKNEIKGVENFHKILVLEAESSGKGMGTGGLASQDKVKIELRPLTDAIWKDSLWSGYAKDNRDELGQSFRLPPMLRGDTDKLNRATAKITRESTEQQVFGPERRDYEFEIDRTILTALRVMLWQFKLNTAEQSDAEQLADIVEKMVAGTISPNEGRRIMSRVLDIELPPFDAEWARMPVKHALAGLPAEPLPEQTQTEGEPAESDGEKDETTNETIDVSEPENVVKLRLPAAEFSRLFVTDENP